MLKNLGSYDFFYPSYYVASYFILGPARNGSTHKSSASTSMLNRSSISMLPPVQKNRKPRYATVNCYKYGRPQTSITKFSYNGIS